MSDPVPITSDLLAAGRTDKGGWSAEQLALLGVSWPPPKGWSKAVVGKMFSPDVLGKFVALRRSSSPPPTTTPGWIIALRSSVPAAHLRVADDVWADRHQFIRWPREPLLFIPSLTRPKSGFHTYTAEHKTRFREAKLLADTKTNGPAVMAYLLAGGERPTRASDHKGWSVHHIYDGRFAAPGWTATTHAVNHPDYFTEAAGLVAVHPIADALAEEFAHFAWLLRYEAFVRFGFDPDGVFNAAESSEHRPGET